MSTTVDNRVVEMRFDNAQFEKNVSQSMSTLEKLKQSLKLKDASKGFDNLNASAKNVNLSGIGNAVDTVKAKFSALDVIAVTALANITNSAINAGKRIVSALTIDPIKTGFQEYETQMNAVQTILANTQSKGSTIDDVNRALAELNKYADLTIYNFTEMTRNIGTFTAAGIDLETSVSAIQGIANLAAVSGSTSQQASTAMYQLSQALSAGTVKLMDWNSVVNAGMGGEIFQNALKETSRLLGTGADAAIKAEGSFRESLSTGWLTAEVLTETLKKFTTSGANEYVAEYTGLSQETVQAALEAAKAQYGEADAIEYASKALAEKSGKNANEIKDALQMAKNAEDAATKVKTFTQLWDVMKEAAQSGWAQTWQIIIGDFEEAKAFFTPLSEKLTGVISSMSDARNAMLKGALGSKWEQLTEKVEKAGFTTEEFAAKVEEAAKESGISIDSLIKEYGSLAAAIKAGKIPTDVFTKALKKLVGSENKATKATKELGDVVGRVLNGEFGVGEERVRKLTEAGYDYAEVQNAINEKLGSSVRHLSSLTEEQKKNADQLAKLSDAQLKNKGYTEEQIQALRELEKAAEDGGTSINELIDSLNKPSGRTLLLDSINNILEAIGETLKIVKEAWDSVFKSDDKEAGEGLYSMIEALHEFTETLKYSEKADNNFRTIMEGVFSGFKLGTSLISMSLVSGLKILDAVLKILGTNMVEVAAFVAELITKFANWVEENTMLINGIDKIAEVIAAVIKGVQSLIDAFMGLKIVRDAIEKVKNAIESLFDKLSLKFSGFSAEGIAETITSAFQKAINWIKTLDSSEVAKSFVNGLVNSISSAASLIPKGLEVIVSTVKQLGSKLVEGFRSIPPDMISGFISGLGSGISNIIGVLVDLANTIIETVKGVLGINSPSTKFIEIGKNCIEGLINGLKEGLSGLWNTLKRIGEGIIEVFKSIDFGMVFAAAMGVGFLFTVNKMIDIIEKFSGPFVGLGKIFTSVSGVIDQFANKINAEALETKSKAIKNLALSILMLVGAVYVLGKMDIETLKQGGIALTVLGGILVGLMALANRFGDNGFKMGALSLILLSFSSSILIISFAIKKLSGIKPEQMKTVIDGLTHVVIGMIGLIAVSSIAGENASKAGTMLIKMSFALLVMVGAIKLMSTIDLNAAKKGIVAIGILTLFFKAMIKISMFSGPNVGKVGAMLWRMSLAILIMVGVIKLISMLDNSAIVKGIATIGLIGILFVAIIKASEVAGKYSRRAGGMLLMMSVALMLMVSVIKKASELDKSQVLKGIGVVSLIGVLFAGIIAVSKFAGKYGVRAGVLLLGMATALLITVNAIKKIAGLDKSDLEKSLKTIATLELLFIGIIAISQLAGKYAVRAGVMLLAMSASLLILAGVIVILSKIDPSGLKRAVTTVAVLELLFAGIIAASYLAKDCTKSLIVITVALTLLSVALVALSFIDPKKLAASAAALSSVMIAFGILVRLSEFTRGIKMGPIVAMLGVVGALAGIVYLLSNIDDPNKALKAIGGICALMLSMAAAMTLASLAGEKALYSVGSLALMGLVVAEIAVILGALSYLNIEPSLKTVAGLSALLLAMSAALVIASYASPNALLSVGALALMGIVVAELGGILAALAYFDVQPSIETAKSLSILLISMSAALVLLGAVGTFGPAAFTGIGALAVLIAGIGTLIVAIGALVTKFPVLEQFLNTGIPILEKIGHALGSFFGNIAGGFMSGVTNGLPEIGTDLSNFMTNIQPFVDGAKSIDASSMEGVKTLVGVIKSLTSANLIESLTSWATGGSSLSDFAQQLVPFGKAMTEYSQAVAGMDANVVTSSATAAKVLAEMANSIPNMGGLAAVFAGENSLTDFATQLVPFGESLKAYSISVVGINAEAITNSATAAKALADMASVVPNMGGLVSFFAGDNSLATFGANLVSFGASLKAYSESVTGLATEPIYISVDATNALSAMNSSIPNMGGLVSFFAGDNNLATFGANLVLFGKALVEYSESVSGINVGSISTSVNAASTLVDLANNLPESGVFTSDDFANFGRDIKSLGKALSNYSESVAGIDTGAVNSSVNAIRRLVSLAKSLVGFDNSGIKDFKIKPLGESLSSYSSSVSTINIGAVNSSIVSARSLASFVKSLSGIDTSGVSSFKRAIAELSTVNVSGIIKAFSSASGKLKGVGGNLITSLVGGMKAKQGSVKSVAASTMTAFAAGLNSKKATAIKIVTTMISDMLKAIKSKNNSFKAAGVALITNLISGINSKRAAVNSAVKSCLAGAASSLRSYYGSFYSAGSYIAQGFANGIRSGSFAAKTAATAMANAAKNAARRALDENSPSKEFYKIGAFAGQGFVNALYDYADVSYKAGSVIADYARDGLNKAVSKAADIINSDIDTQPTIRPVMDLSDIVNGSRTMNKLLGEGAPVSVMANVGSISSMMNRNQNGVNSDLVSAINKLRGDLSNIGNTTYTVNGVTYGDGSEISKAVRTLVRAAKIERRS